MVMPTSNNDDDDDDKWDIPKENVTWPLAIVKCEENNLRLS